MKLKFSERLGIFKPKTIIPKEQMPNDLRNTLWSLVCDETFGKLSNHTYGNKLSALAEFFRKLWRDFFKIPIDNLSISDGKIYPDDSYNYIRKWFFEAKWYEVYEYLEYCAEEFGHDFVSVCNPYLERELSGFRFVGLSLLEIDSSQEIKEIEKALNSGMKYRSVKIHLESSLKLLTDKRKPDYRNSIKESISAVESLCKTITGNENTTLGQALKILDKQKPIPKSLKSGFSAIYGYASDNGGIRHGLLNDDIEPGQEEAKFMLIACSAFVNYLITKNK
ncbi:AbiJ-NTD4 domain-containing protein [Aquimarina sp. M1]